MLNQLEARISQRSQENHGDWSEEALEALWRPATVRFGCQLLEVIAQ